MYRLNSYAVKSHVWAFKVSFNNCHHFGACTVEITLSAIYIETITNTWMKLLSADVVQKRTWEQNPFQYFGQKWRASLIICNNLYTEMVFGICVTGSSWLSFKRKTDRAKHLELLANNHRVIEFSGSTGPTSLLKQGLPRAHGIGLCPENSGMSPMRET